MSDEGTDKTQTLGEVHLVFRYDGELGVSTNLSLPELNLALDAVKREIVNGTLQIEEV